MMNKIKLYAVKWCIEPVLPLEDGNRSLHAKICGESTVPSLYDKAGTKQLFYFDLTHFIPNYDASVIDIAEREVLWDGEREAREFEAKQVIRSYIEKHKK